MTEFSRESLTQQEQMTLDVMIKVFNSLTDYAKFLKTIPAMYKNVSDNPEGVLDNPEGVLDNPERVIDYIAALNAGQINVTSPIPSQIGRLVYPHGNDPRKPVTAEMLHTQKEITFACVAVDFRYDLTQGNWWGLEASYYKNFPIIRVIENPNTNRFEISLEENGTIKNFTTFPFSAESVDKKIINIVRGWVNARYKLDLRIITDHPSPGPKIG